MKIQFVSHKLVPINSTSFAPQITPLLHQIGSFLYLKFIFLPYFSNHMICQNQFLSMIKISFALLWKIVEKMQHSMAQWLKCSIKWSNKWFNCGRTFTKISELIIQTLTCFHVFKWIFPFNFKIIYCFFLSDKSISEMRVRHEKFNQFSSLRFRQNNSKSFNSFKRFIKR